MMRSLIIIALACVVLLPFQSDAAPDPVLYLSFDNISGDTVPDLSGFGNDGTLQADPEIIDGRIGKALEFEESQVAVFASDSLSTEIFADGMFTVVLWINAKRTGDTWQQVFRAGPDPNDTLFLNNDGRLSWRGWVGGGWAGGMCETDPGVVEADTWTHAAVVSDTSNFRIYVNGELSMESEFQQTRGNNQEFMVGGYSGGESYSGAIDEFAIFTEPLGEADIRAIVNDGLQGLLAVEPADKLATQWGTMKLAF